MAQQEIPQELVELHFELEIDEAHAFHDSQVITHCIAKVMKIDDQLVFFDAVERIDNKNRERRGLFKGHIPTTKNDIEHFVQIFYNSLQSQKLHQMIEEISKIPKPKIEIRELYETDQNDLDENDMDNDNENEMGDENENENEMDNEQYLIDEEEEDNNINHNIINHNNNNNMMQPVNEEDIMYDNNDNMNINNNNNNNMQSNINETSLMINNNHSMIDDDDEVINDIPNHHTINNNINNLNKNTNAVNINNYSNHNMVTMEEMLSDLKEMLNDFIKDTEQNFNELLQECTKQLTGQY